MIQCVGASRVNQSNVRDYSAVYYLMRAHAPKLGLMRKVRAVGTLVDDKINLFIYRYPYKIGARKLLFQVMISKCI